MVLRTSEYDIVLEHIAEKQNIVENALSLSVVTEDYSVKESRFDVFDEDNDNDGPDKKPPVESVPDETISVEQDLDGVSILAKIKIGAGLTR